MNRTPRVCNSVGHGKKSRPGSAFDPGADVLGPGTEATHVLTFVKHLDANLAVLFKGHPGAFHMIRDGGLFSLADDEAVAHAVDLFQEFHTNAIGKKPKRDKKEVGVEVLYEDPADEAYAAKLSAAIAKALGLPDRGAKQDTGLAVLSPHRGMRQVLVELFFGSDADDVAAWAAHRFDAELAVINVMLDLWGWHRVKKLPRRWNAAQRAFYRVMWKRRSSR